MRGIFRSTPGKWRFPQSSNPWSHFSKARSETVEYRVSLLLLYIYNLMLSSSRADIDRTEVSVRGRRSGDVPWASCGTSLRVTDAYQSLSVYLRIFRFLLREEGRGGSRWEQVRLKIGLFCWCNGVTRYQGPATTVAEER